MAKQLIMTILELLLRLLDAVLSIVSANGTDYRDSKRGAIKVQTV